jgi:ribose 1,5-bisphosphate isomerase
MNFKNLFISLFLVLFMNKFDRICKQIKEVKIQGARNVAIAAVKALHYKHDKRAIRKLISLRPTEPMLRNSLKFVFSHIDIEEGISDAMNHFEFAKKKTIELGAKFIKNNSTVFTFCHSSTVIDTLKYAKKQGKKFQVIQTETRPLYQGRITAKELAKAKIKVTHLVDSAARVALKKADIMLIGCDAISTTRIYNKIGSEMMALLADYYGVPVYVLTDSWKFDPETLYGVEKIEERPSKEIWENPPKGIKIKNLAFEAIDPKLVDGIITELGIFMKKSFIAELKRTYPWMFL